MSTQWLELTNQLMKTYEKLQIPGVCWAQRQSDFRWESCVKAVVTVLIRCSDDDNNEDSGDEVVVVDAI